MPAGDPLELLLEGRYPDPETGEMLAASARAIAIEPSLDGAEAELVRRLDIGRHFVIVSDVHTHEALGRRVHRALGGQSIVLPDGVVAASVSHGICPDCVAALRDAGKSA